ncbi:disintegrin and metalloproteinase domain-containing protein 5-like [Ursus americanus]|uniref:disintegrin and metalloproteinase domain-containing protein 5-like n=1 Tax=Ursus americanus TaxID=9643 RepID=UPI001E67966D|nr:disintegrin and metalloproteinase domain-containing protein 5-like [Ursus americanus]
MGGALVICCFQAWEPGNQKGAVGLRADFLLSPELPYSHTTTFLGLASKQSGGVKEFSTCTLDDFKYLASNSGFECLQNILPEVPVYKQAQKKVCGNGKLEKGEECDCGTVKNCTHKDCCEARLCVMKKGKQCGSGECCTLDCKLKPIGMQCRKPSDECDFPEYCNGVSSHCVADTYARDGQSCNSGDAFCFGGRCRIHTKQCRDLIGGASRGGPFACYDEVNSRGDRYGNCGRKFCAYPNLLCGKLVCAWPHKALISRANLSIIYTHVREEMCVSTFRVTDKIPKNPWTTIDLPEERDDTFVQDGTVCGPDMVCNNLNHCQCEKGFDPPTCLEKKGEFGSIDDGHKAPSVVYLLLKSVRIQSVLASASQKIQIKTSNTEGVIGKLVVRCGFGLEARTGSSWGKKDADSSDHKVAVRFENFHGEEGK